MKKFAVAMLGAVAAMGASAANVQLYGTIDTYVEAYNNGDKTAARLSAGGASPSAIGLRGEEDLGNGLKAFFGLEQGLLLDQGSGTPDAPTKSDYMFQRHSFVGLKGAMGSFSMGYQYTPTFIVLASMDPVGFSLGSAMGTFASPTTQGINGGRASDLTVRRANSFSYMSPKIGNFVFHGFASLGEVKNSDGDVSSTKGNYYGASVRYLGGPLTAALAFGTQKAQFHMDANGKQYSGNDYQVDFAVNYDFGFIKPAINLAWKKGNDKAEGLNGNMNSEDIFVAQVGFSMPVASGKWMASVGYASNQTKDNADAFAIGTRYEYPLSKQTFVYTGVMAVFNQRNAKYDISGGGGSTAAIPTAKTGDDASTVFFGINTKF